MSHIPTPVAVGEGGTGASSASTARTNLGLGTLATQNANSVSISGGTVTGITDLAVADGGTGASTLTGYVKGSGTAALTASATIPNTDITGLGTMSTQAASNVAITGGSITGITDLAIADGGTGASTQAAARSNLGVTATGADTTYAYRANNLSDLANAATARSNLGVTATGSDTTYAYRANNLSDLTNSTTARGNLGLGSMATQNSGSVSISGGSISGITDLAVADGGTGASSLTGYVYGNGTSAMTASTSIAGSAISGNISGNAANITAYTINQNVGTGNRPTFVGAVVTSPIRHTPTSNLALTGTGLSVYISEPLMLAYSTTGTAGIAGITSGIGNEDGMVQYVINTSSTNNLQLEHDSPSVTAATRILCPGGVAYTIGPATGVCLVYATASGTARWIVVKG